MEATPSRAFAPNPKLEYLVSALREFSLSCFSFYMVSNKSSYSHKKGLSADANRPTNNYMKVISFCNWWAATSQPLRQKSVCSAHYANYFKENSLKKRRAILTVGK